MAILIAGLLVLNTFAFGEPDPDDVASAAEQAGVDPIDLQGALVTVGEDSPLKYLFDTGQLTPPQPTPSTPSTPYTPYTPYGVWDRLAQCESGGNWATNSYYDGGLQFLPSTWNAYKPAGYPAFAYQATREQQILVATRLQAARGWGQWPACSRRLGLR
jgi:hypothetical protein